MIPTLSVFAKIASACSGVMVMISSVKKFGTPKRSAKSFDSATALNCSVGVYPTAKYEVSAVIEERETKLASAVSA